MQCSQDVGCVRRMYSWYLSDITHITFDIVSGRQDCETKETDVAIITKLASGLYLSESEPELVSVEDVLEINGTLGILTVEYNCGIFVYM